MGIVDWFTNDLSTEERALTRDLLSVAIADHEFSEEEQKTILEICETEDISLVEMMDSIRDKKSGAKLLRSTDEKKRYLLHLIKMMSADGRFPSLELHIIEVVAKKLEVNPMQLLSFVLDEISESRISKDDGLVIINNFVKHYITIGLE
ncbi:MAG: TerB family tellurite resistance protein [Prevotella ruminicola]|jgi:uncharacterized tellurite resistance protein B-like protein|uniref:TerB family tellurite resistance protein n=1 Tax=Xylanibacter ruminicola TaxID=839 RepID=A0A9D5P2T3_XYLRU|nr:TerB family tellurite resistance protein [Xylanibacter ruminicola]